MSKSMEEAAVARAYSIIEKIEGWGGPNTLEEEISQHTYFQIPDAVLNELFGIDKLNESQKHNLACFFAYNFNLFDAGYNHAKNIASEMKKMSEAFDAHAEQIKEDDGSYRHFPTFVRVIHETDA